ncbi:MAG: hypothetical protein FJX77_09310 [Armatimonadetes bacterium]|nr:hypothetical protein [Armatimonadota bacterium]
MKRRSLLGTGLVALLGTPAVAQEAGRGGPPPLFQRELAGMAGLVERPDVQKELKVTEEQRAALERLRSARPERLRAFMMRQRQEGRIPPIQGLADFQAAEEKELTGLLAQEQLARLRQLQLQREGFRAVSRPEVADELALTPTQRAQVAEIASGEIVAMAPGRPGGMGNPEMLRRRLEAARAASAPKLEAVLTPEQKSRLTLLQGPRFAFAPEESNPNSGNRMPRQGRLQVGDVAPGFTLTDLNGANPTRLADFQGKKPVVLVFGSIT